MIFQYWVHFKLSLYNLSVIARQLVVEAIQCKRCILDCFVPRNDGMRQFEMHPSILVFVPVASSCAGCLGTLKRFIVIGLYQQSCSFPCSKK